MYTQKNSIVRKLRFYYMKGMKYLQYKCILFKKQKYQPKVFCIGFIKTGTKSISILLQEIGYDHLTFNSYVYADYSNQRYNKLIDIVSRFDSFDDLPWNTLEMIPRLDSAFPKSKFIYLSRPESEWRQSFLNWSDYLTDNEVDVDSWLNKFRKHREFVASYFSNRENDFISIDISNNKDLELLLTFLDKTSSRIAFPHLNKTKV